MENDRPTPHSVSLVPSGIEIGMFYPLYNSNSCVLSYTNLNLKTNIVNLLNLYLLYKHKYFHTILNLLNQIYYIFLLF